MTTITITGLPLQGTILDTTLIAVETAGITGRIAASSIKNYISSSTLSSFSAGSATITGAINSGSLSTTTLNSGTISTTSDVTIGGVLTVSTGAIGSVPYYNNARALISNSSLAYNGSQLVVVGSGTGDIAKIGSGTPLYIAVDSQGPGIWSGASQTNQGLYFNNTSNYAATFVGGSEISRTTASGLALGTTTILQKLTIGSGSIQLDNAQYLYSKTSTGFATRIIGLTGTNDLYVGSIDAAITTIHFNVNGADRAYIDNTGNLTVNKAIIAQTINAATIGNTGATLTGTITTAAQTNITSVGTLTGLTTSGTIIAATVNAATIGNSGATLTGTISTAAQTNITSLGTLAATLTTQTIVPSANVTYNLGSSTAWYNTIYGTSSHALYADLAERYTSDEQYAPGTVLVFGTDTEVTISTSSNDTKVAGVVTTDPAYLMNSGITGTDVALQGRVPCQVTGDVRRGDLMVTSDIPGVAMTNNNPAPGTIIGKALGTHAGTGVGTIEVVVGRF